MNLKEKIFCFSTSHHLWNQIPHNLEFLKQKLKKITCSKYKTNTSTFINFVRNDFFHKKKEPIIF